MQSDFTSIVIYYHLHSDVPLVELVLVFVAIVDGWMAALGLFKDNQTFLCYNIIF